MKAWSTKHTMVEVTNRKEGKDAASLTTTTSLLASASNSSSGKPHHGKIRSRQNSGVKHRRVPLDYRLLAIIVSLAVPPFGFVALYFTLKSLKLVNQDVEEAWRMAHYSLGFILLSLTCIALALLVLVVTMIHMEVTEYLEARRDEENNGFTTAPPPVTSTAKIILPVRSFNIPKIKAEFSYPKEDVSNLSDLSGDFDGLIPSSVVHDTRLSSVVPFVNHPVMERSTKTSVNVTSKKISSVMSDSSPGMSLSNLHQVHGGIKRTKSTEELLQASNLKPGVSWDNIQQEFSIGSEGEPPKDYKADVDADVFSQLWNDVFRDQVQD